MLDLSKVMNQATREGWALVALDVAVDTSTPSGEAMVNMLTTFAVLERRLTGQRTDCTGRQAVVRGSCSPHLAPHVVVGVRPG